MADMDRRAPSLRQETALVIAAGAIKTLAIALAAHRPGALRSGKLIVAGVLLAFSWSANAAAQSVTEYPIVHGPSDNPASYPFGIVSGPGGYLYFTEGIGRIGRITTAGTIIEQNVPPTKSGQAAPYSITVGPDGALWFGDYDGEIGRIAADGTITGYPVPVPNRNDLSQPDAITTGPDGALWFADAGQNTLAGAPSTAYNAIGKSTTAGAITEYLHSSPLVVGAFPTSITAGSDGACGLPRISATKSAESRPAATSLCIRSAPPARGSARQPTAAPRKPSSPVPTERCGSPKP